MISFIEKAPKGGGGGVEDEKPDCTSEEAGRFSQQDILQSIGNSKHKIIYNIWTMTYMIKYSRSDSLVVVEEGNYLQFFQ